MSGWIPTKAVRTSSGGVPGNIVLWGGGPRNASTWAQDSGFTPASLSSSLSLWELSASMVRLKVTYPLNLQNERIENVADPTSAQDAATKAYVDGTHTLGNQISPPLVIGDTSGDPHVYYLREGRLCDD